MRTLIALLLACALAGCGPSRRELYDNSVAAFRDCAATKGVTGCEAERAIMVQQGAVYQAWLSDDGPPNLAAPSVGAAPSSIPRSTICRRIGNMVSCF
jgi:hypothetical protein